MYLPAHCYFALNYNGIGAFIHVLYVYVHTCMNKLIITFVVSRLQLYIDSIYLALYTKFNIYK